MSRPAGNPGGFSRFRVNLGYDGTNFAGWAKQPGLRTVQSEMLAALEQIFGPDDRDFGMRVAGRTDAGVHAMHQVIHIDLTQQQLKRLGRTPLSPKKINSLMATDVRVHSVGLAPGGFEARFSALGRSYRYRIADADIARDPLSGRYTLWYARQLDVELMHKTAQKLLGLKDFATFCRPRAGSSTIRNLRKFDVGRDAEGVIIAELEADAFCHNMVRALVGGLIAVGEGRLQAAELIELHRQARRSASIKVIAAHGLTLMGVEYPADDQLAVQAELARNMRGSADISV